LRLEGRTCIVTGGTAGIGFVVARELAHTGATVVTVARNAERGARSVEEIRRETGNANVEFMRADLSSLVDVRHLAHEIRARHSRIHVLVNNAGGFFARRRESVEGIEMTLALNHLGPFLLTNLLLDLIEAGAPSRIVNVASEAHEDVDRFDFDDPQATKRAYPRTEAASLFYALVMPWRHPGYTQYAYTKLANILFTTQLARRLEGTGVVANALHPGIVATEFGRGNGMYGWLMQRYLAVRGISPEEGARTVLHLATSPEAENISGRYFVRSRPVAPSLAAQDREDAARLWNLSFEMTARVALKTPS
jgi:NAD(P)-dependent dehydrogenase (short-subunit alcohol dehydrogenase family)